jgi:RNA polymerase sigma-70 factor (ECF subfamily)
MDIERRTTPATTNWNLIRAAGARGTPESDDALARLCGIYWFPVYAFVRHQGYDAERAHDLTQEFFARLIEKQYLRDVRPKRGRFRCFLVAAVRHFLSNERDRERAAKRGGGRRLLSLDAETAEGRYAADAADHLTPEKLFDRQWALALLAHVLCRLGDEMAAAGRSRQFLAMKGLLTENEEHRTYREVGRELGMTEGALKVAVHRLRRRYGQLLRQELGACVGSVAETEAELRHLRDALS